MNKTVQAMYREPFETRSTDTLLEVAIEASANVAKALGDTLDANQAWCACFTLKALRRGEVVDRLEAARLAAAQA